MNDITLTLTPEIQTGLGIALATLVIAALLHWVGRKVEKNSPPLDKLANALGIEGLHPILVLLGALFWLGLFVMLSVGLVTLIWDVIWHEVGDLLTNDGKPDSDKQWSWRFKLVQVTALAGILGALVTLPLTLTRLRVSKESNDHAEDRLFNEKFQTAAADLHSRREVKLKLGPVDGEKENYIEDDVIRRVAAIDTLFGLVQERPAEAPRLCSLLCAYLRELSKLIGPDSPEHPRADMQAAAQTIGKLRLLNERLRIDLRNANLNGFELVNADFTQGNLEGVNLQEAQLYTANLQEAQLDGANLQGARLHGANLQEARLDGAKLQGARLDGAKLQGARLLETNLQEAQLYKANLQEARLYKVNLQEARLDGAKLQGARLHKVNLQEARLKRANLQGAWLHGAKLQGARLDEANLQGARLHGANLQEARLLDNNLQEAQLYKANLQGAWLHGAKLQGAWLDEAKLQGARLYKANLDVSTSLTRATLRGALVSEVDDKTITVLKPFWQEIFVYRPSALRESETPPDHWETEQELSSQEIEKRWREWQKSIEFDPESIE